MANAKLEDLDLDRAIERGEKLVSDYRDSEHRKIFYRALIFQKSLIEAKIQLLKSQGTLDSDPKLHSWLAYEIALLDVDIAHEDAIATQDKKFRQKSKTAKATENLRLAEAKATNAWRVFQELKAAQAPA